MSKSSKLSRQPSTAQAGSSVRLDTLPDIRRVLCDYHRAMVHVTGADTVRLFIAGGLADAPEASRSAGTA